MPEKVIILIPPSEGKAPGGKKGKTLLEVQHGFRATPANAFHLLDEARAEVRAALAKAFRSGKGLEKIFGVKGKPLEAATAANQGLDATPLMPAIERYQGVMFDAISYPTLSKAGKKNFDRWAIILSGLFGALRPRDLIPDYKLKIDARLPGAGKLDQFWGPHLTAGLKKALRGAIVWDLLPGAHRRAFGNPAGPSAIYTVRFVEKAGRELKNIGHGSKPLRGQLIRGMAEEGLFTPDKLALNPLIPGFRVEFDPKSHSQEVLLVRKGSPPRSKIK